MKRISSFPPICDPNATVLILGSMPGVQSLAAGQYYAHARNAFWPIMERVLGLEAGRDYADRVEALRAARIAVWDVLHSCHRIGSLDTNIRPDTIKINNFLDFFRRHPRVELICFNGSMAENEFRRHVLPGLSSEAFRFVKLPSTSPANTMTLDKKAKAWMAELAPVIAKS